MEAWSKPAGNLSPNAANKRLRQGVIVLGIALVIAVVLAKAQVHPAWRLLLFIPFFVSAAGFYQGLFRA